MATDRFLVISWCNQADNNSEITKTMLLGLLDLVQEKQIRLVGNDRLANPLTQR